MHPTQLEILDSLRQDQSRQFNQLLRDVAETSDNLTYHLRQLQKIGFIESSAKGEYSLADKGLVYLNNNLELSHDLFPTVSCMLELHGPGDSILLMKKLKQPFLGAIHLPTFGVTSSQPLPTEISEFLERYKIEAHDLTFKGTHRERHRRQDLAVFDKFFMVFQGRYITFKTDIEDRQFTSVEASELAVLPYMLPATKAVLDLKPGHFFSESTLDSVD